MALWMFTPQVQNSALQLVKPCGISVHLFLQPVKIPLDVSLIIWSISHSSLFCVISKYSEATLCLTTQVINEDFKQNRAQQFTRGVCCLLLAPK